MNLKTKIIITDTNIITDLNNAKVLDKFIKLDNVYMVDMVKNDEVNSKTCDVNIIDNIKEIVSSDKVLNDIIKLKSKINELSFYDLLNYKIAKINNYILATGDNRLKRYAEENNVLVIRTLTIIRFMYDYNIITLKETINACNLLKNNPYTRIPINEIDILITDIEKNSVTC